MSDKRFIIVKSIENYYALVDKEREDKEQILIFSLHKEQLGVVCDLLNEQQARIELLEDNCLADNLTRKHLEGIINEQQTTIEQLQDLCGESDGENAKLRQEIKELKAQLREKEQDERLYANEIVKLNKEAKEVLDFKSLGGDY